jgi:hypothetical protein
MPFGILISPLLEEENATPNTKDAFCVGKVEFGSGTECAVISNACRYIQFLPISNDCGFPGMCLYVDEEEDDESPYNGVATVLLNPNLCEKLIQADDQKPTASSKKNGAKVSYILRGNALLLLQDEKSTLPDEEWDRCLAQLQKIVQAFRNNSCVLLLDE